MRKLQKLIVCLVTAVLLAGLALLASENTELAYEDFEAFNGMRVGLLTGNSRSIKLFTEHRL